MRKRGQVISFGGIERSMFVVMTVLFSHIIAKIVLFSILPLSLSDYYYGTMIELHENFYLSSAFINFREVKKAQLAMINFRESVI